MDQRARREAPIAETLKSSGTLLKENTVRGALIFGLVDAARLPGVVLLASMIGFGALCERGGFSVWLALSTTGAVWGLPGQIAFVELNAAGGSVVAIVLAAAMANARFLPMTVTLLPLCREGMKEPRWFYLWSHFVSLITWTWVVRRFPRIPAHLRIDYYIGFGITSLIVGFIGTAAGHVMAAALPVPVTLGLMFLIPVYFILLFADVSRRLAVLALLFGAVAWPLLQFVSPDWSLLMAGFGGGTLAFLVRRGFRARGVGGPA